MACFLIEPIGCITLVPKLSFYSIYLERYIQNRDGTKLLFMSLFHNGENNAMVLVVSD